MAGPLDGVRILDCTTVVLGPWAAQQLGDLGADVIKIEPPEGDTTRQLGPARNPGMAAFYLGCNRNKRSIVLDLKQDAGRRALFKLAETADVLMHNYRPRAGAAAGRRIRGIREDQSAARLSGDLRLPLGRPDGAKAAYDDIIQAGSGLASLQTVVAGQPRFLPTIVADKTSSQRRGPPCWPPCSRASAPARARRSRCRCSRRWLPSSWSSISTARRSGRRSRRRATSACSTSSAGPIPPRTATSPCCPTPTGTGRSSAA